MLDKVSLLSYMVQGHIHLSKKDYGFFHNIKLTIQDKKPITTNQTKLFDKLIHKYKRQLDKLGHKSDELVMLPWKCEVIDTQPEFLEARIFLDNDKIIIKSPFSTKFIKDFRKITQQGMFSWDKERKVYAGIFSTYNLKTAIDNVTKHYDQVTYCQDINDILLELKYYESCKFWTPTLVKCNDTYLIAAINENLFEAIKDISLNAEPTSLHILTQYGIKVDDSVLTDDFSRFASEFFTSVDLDKLDMYAAYLKKLHIDFVVFARELLYTKEISKEVKDIFSKHDIDVRSLYDYNGEDAVLINYRLRMSEYNEAHISKASKILSITNSRPVVVK